jgi:hypothetical protein
MILDRDIIKKIVKGISNPRRILNVVLRITGKNLSDDLFLKIQYRLLLGEKLNIKNPILFNEKLQWLKLYNRHEIYTDMADKYAVRKYVGKTIGEQYLIRIIGVWDKFEDIDFSMLPKQFVLKCTHDSASVVICKDKNNFNTKKAGKKLKTCLKHNYYTLCREWVYKDIPPKIIAEEYLVDESETELKDYKIFCFNGVPKLIQVDYDRFSKHKRNIYTPQWEYVPMSFIYSQHPETQIDKPKDLNLLLELAQKLSANIPFVRIDFYITRSSIFFGEITFYPEAGYGKITPSKYNLQLGELINLPNKTSQL